MAASRDSSGRFIKGSGGGGKVTVTDKGLTATVARLKKATGGATLKVGIIGEEAGAEHGDITVAQLAEIHEFGLGVPQRSFIGGWADEMREEHRSQIRKVGKAVASGKIESVEEGLERLGALFVGQVQKRMAEGIDPPLAESTIARKGSSTPLIDTGVLRSSVTFEVTK